MYKKTYSSLQYDFVYFYGSELGLFINEQCQARFLSQPGSEINCLELCISNFVIAFSRKIMATAFLIKLLIAPFFGMKLYYFRESSFLVVFFGELNFGINYFSHVF